MNIKTIFNKRVDRPIEGVIKADDEESVRLEFEEYVLTNEVEKRLESFLEAYNDYTGANGVWVSGFFGSGKSHLLKILALLIENRHIDGIPALELFLPKCTENVLLGAELKRAVSIPSKSILFNIDQKADIISKTQFDALLSVFVKVFDDMCGYYGKQGHIAQFERDLDRRGSYATFRVAYQQVAKIPWETGREQSLLESQNIALAYAQATGSPQESAIGILDKYRSQYKMSIEDFAEQVKVYIDKQVPNFRLNFYIDEVGQYIATHRKLMTNLQSIAESFATKCRGRAWIIVTAQDDMSTVIGELDKKENNQDDFSRIQARFANRMKLTSADVEEVIQKRLLEKKEEVRLVLSTLYHQEANNFRTLFDFADSSHIYQNFKDVDHFINSYPFVPYQFSLFQSAIQNLSLHSAFEGRHSSVGERSMLGVFQKVLKDMVTTDIGQLATFDLMFEGIRSSLKSNIQRAIFQAERHLANPLGVRVLKVLFLVKYVKEFKSTVHNLCVLMRDGFQQEMPQLKKQMEDVLNLLEQQTYIQRNGDLYEYLTDEEKDIEQEIKNTEIKVTEVGNELEKIIFDYIIKNRKFRLDDMGQDYSFSRKIDGKLHGREYELAIHVISPFYDKSGEESTLKMHNMGTGELLVIIPQDERLVRDMIMYKRTETYIRQNITTTTREMVKRILSDKGTSNGVRHTEIQQRITMLLGMAKLFVNGNEVVSSVIEPVARITRGFYELVLWAYPNRQMLGASSYTENMITTYLKAVAGGLYRHDESVSAISEAEQEVVVAIQNNSRTGVRTTLKLLVEKFEQKPYGWYLAALLCILAKLCARGKVEVRSEGNVLEGSDIERALRNTRNYGNIIIEAQIEFTASQVRQLKEFYEDFFDCPPSASEARELGKETQVKFQELQAELVRIKEQKAQYPFLQAVSPAITQLAELQVKSYTWYLSDLLKYKQELLRLKEDIIDPIRGFMNSSKKDSYTITTSYMKAQESNFPYILSAEVEQITDILVNPECFKGNCMQQVKVLFESLQYKVETQLQEEISAAKKILLSLRERLTSMDDFNALPPKQQSDIVDPFQILSNKIEKEVLIAIIRDQVRRFEEKDYQQILIKIHSLFSREPEKPEDIEETTGTIVPEIEYIANRSIHVSFEKPWLANEIDIDNYLQRVRSAMLTEIRKGKRIQI